MPVTRIGPSPNKTHDQFVKFIIKYKGTFILLTLMSSIYNQNEPNIMTLTSARQSFSVINAIHVHDLKLTIT